MPDFVKVYRVTSQSDLLVQTRVVEEPLGLEVTAQHKDVAGIAWRGFSPQVRGHVTVSVKEVDGEYQALVLVPGCPPDSPRWRIELEAGGL